MFSCWALTVSTSKLILQLQHDKSYSLPGLSFYKIYMRL